MSALPIVQLLQYNSFSEKFITRAKEILPDKYFAVHIRDINVCKYVLQEFTPFCSNNSYSSRSMIVDEEEKDQKMIITHCKIASCGIFSHGMEDVIMCMDKRNDIGISLNMSTNPTLSDYCVALVSKTSIKTIENFVERLTHKKVGDKRVVYRMTQDSWAHSIVRKRPKNTLYCNHFKGILNETETFFNDKSWYDDHHVPYRRGFLFYGPPGTGKTTCAHVLASELDLVMYQTQFFPGMTDSDLLAFVAQITEKCIVLIEDVDSYFDSHRQTVSGWSFTFGGLIHAIDELITKKGVIFIMTTNNADILDDALTRPGRIDSKYKFKETSKNDAISMIKSFYPGCTNNQQLQFAQKVYNISPVDQASLQEFFVKNRKRKVEKVIEDLNYKCKRVKSTSTINPLIN